MPPANETWIILTPAEILIAAIAGVMRQSTVIKKDLEGRYGEPKNNCWQRHIEGALTECAMAKHLGLYWQGKGEPGDRDLEAHEIRSAQEHYKRLMLHPRDKDDSKYWFLTGQYGRYKLHGWVMGVDGKKEEYWEKPTKDQDAAFFVPQDALVK